MMTRISLLLSIKYTTTGTRANSIEEARAVVKDLISTQEKQFAKTPLANRPPLPVNLNTKYNVEVFTTLQLLIVLCRENVLTKDLVLKYSRFHSCKTRQITIVIICFKTIFYLLFLFSKLCLGCFSFIFYLGKIQSNLNYAIINEGSILPLILMLFLFPFIWFLFRFCSSFF